MSLKKPRCVIYDIDGTIADSTVRATKHIDLVAKRKGHFQKYRDSLNVYSQTCENDVTIPTGIKIVHGLALAYDAVPVAVTARGNNGRIPTLEWLIANLPWRVSNDLLIMRPEADDDPTGWVCHAPSEEYKEHVLAKLFEDWTVCAAVDDHLGVCNMYKRNGIAALHVLYPDIDCFTAAGEHIAEPKAV